ncbi:hypothetical protein ACXIU3_23195 [Vibrio parahaemolyticus]|uniref:hypothetical protein n=1 Tax=Vibrio parahaemolyticus TaxID=670 RepID=UPI00111F7C30|nr:hypothetical protein [Vibrio parahaemolyticus]EGQ8037409.1 hypothetical protein [Vibrio parahaemolyticus]EHH2498722.1 hypothetical protein [Vibrio parahaemolyticus]EHR0875127.1 hypothetical protein [Vibrio parahaemolyticus]EID4329067.1 hypothetical protein [Vibrio parahaemolyticus]EJV0610124.1 hypothetical protein [Vibrio parahaemolyticus]
MPEKIKESRYFRVTLNGQIMLVFPFVMLMARSLVVGDGRIGFGLLFLVILIPNLFRHEIKYLLKHDKRFLAYFVVLNFISIASMIIHGVMPILLAIPFGIFIGFYSVYRYDGKTGSDTTWTP